MSVFSNERVVYQCKLHPGIFVWPAIGMFCLMLPGLIYLIQAHQADSTVDEAMRTAIGVTRTQMIQSAPPQVQALLSHAYFWAYFWIFFPAMLGGAVAFAITLNTFKKSEIILTEDRLKFKTGWLSLGNHELLLSKIETTTRWEPILGRMVGYGTVSVTSTGGAVFPIRFLPKPEYLNSLLQSSINQAPAGHGSSSIAEINQGLADMDARYMPKG